MARFAYVSPVVALACISALPMAACGGRTDRFIDGYEPSGGGSPSWDGGGLPDAGGTSPGGRGSGGRRTGTGGRGAGGYYPGTGGRRNTGGYYQGNGGYFPGYGGTTTGGCFYPTCQCMDCVSQCTCNGTSYGYCYDSCYGTGGFGGGSGGYGGSAGAPGCDVRCPSATVPSVGISLSGCCTTDGSCGISTDPIASYISIQAGCQAYNQPGIFDGQCPVQASPVGPALQGCCRPDGTCGSDLGQLGLGCVQGNSGGLIRLCIPGGTAAGGSPPIDQCFMSTSCEQCACKACGAGSSACFQDRRCEQIVDCFTRTGCSGADCYQVGTCQAIIDATGGLTGPSLMLAGPLLGCMHDCACYFTSPIVPKPVPVPAPLGK